jgi:glutamate-1-semialdehyde aminotransferase
VSTTAAQMLRAAGSYREAIDGRRYRDYHAAFGPIILGHSYPAVVDGASRALRDQDLFVRYRRELIARGVFELPINLKRNHVMFSHTDADVDLTLQAAEDALGSAPARRGS